MDTPLLKSILYEDDMKKWPPVSDIDIFSYLIEQKACDLREVKAYKSTAAYNYFVSGCVGQVLIGSTADFVFLQAQVRPSQSVNETYRAWVSLLPNGSVESGGCQCKAGLSAVCSHVASILYKVSYAHSRRLCGEVCTDIQQKWNSGTSRNVIPSSLATTNLKRPKKGMDFECSTATPHPNHLSPIKRLKTAEELIQHASRSMLSQVFSRPGTVFHQMLNSSNPESTERLEDSIIVSIKQKLPHGNHVLIHDHNEKSCCQSCLFTYQNLVCGSEISYQELRDKTLSQSQTADVESLSVWKFSRKIRITASSAPNVPKKSSTPPINFLENHLFGKFKGNSDTARGHYGEKGALEYFKNKYKMEFQRTGTVVSQREPWLSASPDGVWGIDGIIEIKCPDPSKFDKYLTQASYDLYLAEGNLKIRTNKQYYYQVQFTLYCLQRTKCILIFYFGNLREAIDIQIDYDENFVISKINHLKSFYFTKMLPFLVDNLVENNLPIPTGYKNLFHKKL